MRGEGGPARRRTVAAPSRAVAVRDEPDVLVVGGGLGGVSAALAAARAGARTMLVERNGFPGGVATAGMCCSVFNAFYTADRRLGITGNAVEIVDALVATSGVGLKWHRHKGHIIYDIEGAKLTLIELLEGAGVTCLFDTLVTGTVVEGDVLRGVFIDSKSGHEAVLAKVTVDASGDADVAALAGAPVREMGSRGKHSYVFRIGNVDVDRFVQYFTDHPDQYPDYMDVDWTFEEALAQYRDTGTLLFPHGGGYQMDLFKAAMACGELPDAVGMHDGLAACQMHAIRDLGVVHVITGFTSFDDLDIETISRAMADGKRMAFVVTRFFREHVPGFERACVIGLADDLGMRVTRWIDGDVQFTREMKETPARFPDAIGRGVVEKDYRKNPAEGAWGCQTFTNETFDIPYGCLVPRRIDGLLMGAGRSVSAEGPWLLRVMALTMVVGQGAGVAAAGAAASGAQPRDVDIAAVQAELRRQGVELGS